MRWYFTKAGFTVHTTLNSFCNATKIKLDRSRIGLLFTDKEGDFGAIFVTERNCATPISKVKSRIDVHTVIPCKSVCPITTQFCSVVRKSLSTVTRGLLQRGVSDSHNQIGAMLIYFISE